MAGKKPNNTPPKEASAALEVFFSNFDLKPQPVLLERDTTEYEFHAKLAITNEDEKPIYDVLQGVNRQTYIYLADRIMQIPESEIAENQNDLDDMIQEILNIFSGNVIRDILDDKIYLLTPPAKIKPEPIAIEKAFLNVAYRFSENDSCHIVFSIRPS